MRKLIYALSALSILAVSTPGLAQTRNSAPVASSADVEPRARALAARVMALTMPDFEKQLYAFVENVVDQMGLEEADPEMAAWYAKTASPMMVRHVRVMLAELETLYAQGLSIAEMEAMIAFYDTPMGREIARKQVKLQMDMAIPATRMQENYEAELMEAFCKQFDCGAEATTQGSKSGRR